MGISKSLLSRICLIAGFILCSQVSFATVPVLLPPDRSPTPEPGQSNQMTTNKSNGTASAAISDVELAVFLNGESVMQA